MKAYGYTALSGLAQLFSIGFYLYLARQLTPADYGVVISLVNVSLVAAGMLSMGSNVYLVRELVKGTLSNAQLLSRLLGRTVYSIGLAVLVAVGIIVISGGERLAFGLGAGLLVAAAHLSQLLTVLPLSKRRLSIAGVAQVLEKVVPAVMLVLIDMDAELPPYAVPVILAMGCVTSILITTVWCCVYFRIRGRGLIAEASESLSSGAGLWGSWRNPWAGSGRIGLSYICFSLQPMDVALVTAVSDPVHAGEYAAVSRWTQPTALVAKSLGQAILPRMSGANGIRSAFRELRSVWPALLGVCCLALGVAVFAGPLVSTIIGPEYSDSESALVVLMIATPASFLSQMMYMLLTAQGHDGQCARIVVVVTVVSFALMAVLSQHLGAVGAALGYGAMQTLLCVGFYSLFKTMSIRERR